MCLARISQAIADAENQLIAARGETKEPDRAALDNFSARIAAFQDLRAKVEAMKELYGGSPPTSQDSGYPPKPKP